MAGQELDRRPMAGPLAYQGRALRQNTRPTVTLNGMRIMFKNFAGAAKQYNVAGDRNFVVFLDPDVAEDMAKHSWNIKQLRARDEGDVPQDYIKVKLKYDGPRPPKVFMVNSRGKHQLSEDMIDILDWADIEYSDIIISPYDWNVNGKTGRTAYLQTIFCFLREDELEQKYAHIEDADREDGQLESAIDALTWDVTDSDEIESIKNEEIVYE